MIEGKTVLGIIPARGGSKGVPRKNIRRLAGRPLLAFTIEAARNSRYLDRFVVSSEDPEILAVAKLLGAEILARPAALARDDTPGMDPVLHALAAIPGYDYVVLLQPTSPLRIAEDIDGCIELCIKSGVSCVSITEAEQSPYWMYKRNPVAQLTPLLKIDPDLATRRQTLPKVYVLNGAVYVAPIATLLANRTFLEPDTLGFMMPPERSFDIDTETDLLLVEALMKSQLKGTE